MKGISIYVKGDRNSTAYYRIYQYFDRIDGIEIRYNIMYPRWLQNKYMPIGEQSIYIKILAYIVSYCTILFALLKDIVRHPHLIIIHKRIISRYFPVSFKLLLKYIKKSGVKICWDFDDHIVEGREISQRGFDFMSDISDNISVTHLYLKNLIQSQYRDKVQILPTTDGDLYNYFRPSLVKSRYSTFCDCVKLVWVATSPNLRNLIPFIPHIDNGAKILLDKYRKKVELLVVCDKPLNYKVKSLVITNIKWTRTAAIDAMKFSHIGIMPLLDTEYNKGKGGFKLVQYMSIGLPTIGSSVGFNKNVIGEGCGILCSTPEEWSDAIVCLAQEDIWKKSSKESFDYWKKHFSYERNLNYWKNTFDKYEEKENS